MSLTIKQVNKMLASKSTYQIQKAGVGDYAYFYVTGGDAANWKESAILVNRVGDLTLEQWEAEVFGKMRKHL